MEIGSRSVMRRKPEAKGRKLRGSSVGRCRSVNDAFDRKAVAVEEKGGGWETDEQHSGSRGSRGTLELLEKMNRERIRGKETRGYF